MTDSHVKLGPLALLLTVITICLSILSVLVLTTARADLRLAEKYAQTVERRYALEREGQKALQSLDDALQNGQAPAGFTRDGSLWRLTLEDDDGARLSIAVEDTGGALRVTEWRHDREWDADLTIEGLWPGF